MSATLVANNLPIPPRTARWRPTSARCTRSRCSRPRKSNASPAACATDDLAAAQELVLSHLRFVVHVARGAAATACSWAT